MQKLQLGLTKTYNQFHNDKLCVLPLYQEGTEGCVFPANDFQKKYGKQSLELWKLLDRTEGTITFNEAVEGILELSRLHKEMDELVLAVDGWSKEVNGKWQIANGKEPLTTRNSPITLKHDFYEVDYLPENDRVRYTIHPDARKEILKRLLLLNHEIYEQEIKTGLHKKKDVEAYYESKGMDIPKSARFADVKTTKKKINIDDNTQQLF